MKSVVLVLHWLCIYTDRLALRGRVGTSCSVLLRAPREDIRLRVLLFTHGLFWHFIRLGFDQAVRRLGCSDGDHRQKGNDHRTFLYVLCQTFHFSIYMGRPSGAFWHLPECLQQKQREHEASLCEGP
ncbi:unnamed protein product [Tetraodon nigroviridis]|uniref:(spotted green pufferfish) hypothetical protein n=1 Tax=Tetraodon nigroviridis TaxID=99883 RepID=Q4T762_TETNG|nr:unnamed protein product [Tetraodon nigroviridis]